MLTVQVSSEDVARKGLTGRGLKLLHHYPDLLYGLGSKATPSDSFTPTRIFPQVPASAGYQLHISSRPVYKNLLDSVPGSQLAIQ